MSSSIPLPEDLLLIPEPVRIQRLPGQFQLASRPALFCATSMRYAATCRRELRARSAASISRAAIRLLPAADAPFHSNQANQAEGYALCITADGITIWAATAAGHLYGVMTLRQLLRRFGHLLPCLEIEDAPKLARRGVQLCFPQGHTGYRHTYMKHLAVQLARYKINELYLYLESYFDFPSLPHMAGPEAMTPDHAHDLDQLFRAYNIRLIPMLNTLAHCGELLSTQRYNHLTEYPAGSDQRLARPFNLCASSPTVNQLIDGMLDDLCACFSADTFHVGGDEVSSIGECPRCVKAGAVQPFPLYLKYFGRILTRLAEKNKRGGIWGDMILHYAPDLSAAESRRIFAELRENAIIYDWSYSSGSRKTLDFFSQARLDAIACSSPHLCYASAMWPAQALNQRALFLDAIAGGAIGGMTTAWGNYIGMHEEQFNYLHATGAAILWSGAEQEALAGRSEQKSFDAAYRLQRYGLQDADFTDYLHTVGDAKGPLLSLFYPQHGVELRKNLYHTDNPLLFWHHYASFLQGDGVKKYAAAIARARKQWNAAKKQIQFLASFLRHLKTSHRPLPAFHDLHTYLLSQFETHWYGDREHDWAAEIPRFRRYSVNTREPYRFVVLDREKEREKNV